ncbi:MAG: phosphatidate cytidylyltransferase [Planctomycetes bacterium]|nr:phosphatidate cytidylyltransferase [Planctomycetota bacterium]
MTDAAEPGSGTEAPPAATDDRAKRQRSTRNLLLRGCSALAALALIYFCLYWDVTRASGWAWAALVAAISVIALREFYRLAVECGLQPFARLGYLAGPLILLAGEWDLAGQSRVWGISGFWLVFLALSAGCLLLQLTRKSNDNALNNVSVTIFGVVYCCLLPGVLIHLRHMELAAGGWPMHGIEFAVVCIFVSKVSDVGALLTGSRWGKHKLIPRLSPGKTREGALGGLLFSVFLLQLMVTTAPDMALASLGRGRLLLLSVLLAAGGLAGDLIESSFKRNSQRKDAGTGVPGFGGMLDLIDSLMVAAPVMYFFLVLCGAEYVQ